MAETITAKTNQPSPSGPLDTTPSPNKKHKWPLVIGLFVVLFVGGYFLFVGGTKLSKTGDSVISGLKHPASDPEPTVIPFREMTIPYLREREYKSSLGEMELAYDNLNYIAYLTSYDSDSLTVNALLTKPSGEEPEGGWPAVVFIHGYIPPTIYETMGTAYSSYVDYLARNGFVVLKIDLRGHGSSEGEAGGGYYGSDYVVDTLNAYAALQSADFVNPERIGMWGHSMAGNTLLRSAAARPDIPAIVIWAGAVYTYTDMQKYGIQDNSYRPPMPTNSAQRLNRRRELFEKHGSPSAQSNFWQQVAGTSYLRDLKGAVEIHHAVDDSVVNIGYSRELIALLGKTSIPHQLFEYPSGGHNLEGNSFTQAMERTVDFYRKYLIEK